MCLPAFDIFPIVPLYCLVPLIRTEKQKDNLAKFLYDVAKIVLASVVIAPIVNLQVFSPAAAIGGLVVAGVIFFIAYSLDGKEVRP